MSDQHHPTRKYGLFLILALGVFTFGVFFVFQPHLLAATDTEDVIDNKEDELDAIKQKIKTYKQLVDLKQKEQSTLTTQIESLETQTTRLENEIARNEKTLSDLDRQVNTLSGQITEQEKLILIQKDLLAELMRASYENQNQSAFTLLLSTVDAKQMLQEEGWTLETGAKVKDILEEVQNLRDSLGGERLLLTDKRSEIDALRSQLEQRTNYLDSARDTKERLALQAKSQEKKYSSIVSDLEEERREIEEEIEDLEAAKVGDLDLSTLPAFGKSVLSYPVKDPSVSQKYGKTTFTRWYKFHNGIDYHGRTGQPIYAAADGRVIATGSLGRYAYGKWIAIDHGNGLVTLYGHLNVQSVKKGGSVDRGERIGSMGSTGYSTGPHLHFTVYAKNSFDVVPSNSVKGQMIPTGAHINPTKYLP